ncbi:hypothetical protein MSAN_00897500 [Mycena sanguinolenta]|uniref:Uncharacterized protein n=1 Tax=Mycena sanguinolenta TaxID=230812 RepID=A0A8H6YWC0_9AGAR|nr:hypothetical protein MSAN_00897500 [Mycena sanguinolenta]
MCTRTRGREQGAGRGGIRKDGRKKKETRLTNTTLGGLEVLGDAELGGQALGLEAQVAMAWKLGSMQVQVRWRMRDVRGGCVARLLFFLALTRRSTARSLVPAARPRPALADHKAHMTFPATVRRAQVISHPALHCKTAKLPAALDRAVSPIADDHSPRRPAACVARVPNAACNVSFRVNQSQHAIGDTAPMRSRQRTGQGSVVVCVDTRHATRSTPRFGR